MTSHQKIIERYENKKEFSETNNDLVKSYLTDLINDDFDNLAHLKVLYERELRYLRIYHNIEEQKFDSKVFQFYLSKLSINLKIKQFNRDFENGVIAKKYMKFITEQFQKDINKSVASFSLAEINDMEKDFYNYDYFFKYNNRDTGIELGKKHYKQSIEKLNEHHNLNIEVEYESGRFDKWCKNFVF